MTSLKEHYRAAVGQELVHAQIRRLEPYMTVEAAKAFLLGINRTHDVLGESFNVLDVIERAITLQIEKEKARGG